MYSLKEVQVRFGVPQHILIHLCEKGVIKPEIEDPHGRGKSRKFSLKNVFEFAVALELRKYEIPVSRIGVVIKLLDIFEKSLKKSLPNFSLPESIQGKSPSVTFYIFDGEMAVFSLGQSTHVSFDLNRLIEGNAKRVHLEKIKSLPGEYSSYLKLDFSKLAKETE